MMSAILDFEIIKPVSAPTKTEISRKNIVRATATVKLLSTINRAARQFIRTDSAPIARFIPPPIMIMAWPIERSAIGKIPSRKVLAS